MGEEELKGILEGIQKSITELSEKIVTSEKSNADTQKSVEGLAKVVESVVSKMVNVEKASLSSAQIAETGEETKKSKKTFNPLTGGFNG